MKTDQKKSILKYLASIADKDEVAKQAVNHETDKIAQTLATEIQYDAIKDQIDILDAISYQVHEKAISIFSELLSRLGAIEFVSLHEFQTKEKIIVAILKALLHFRYYESDAIITLFFNYSVHPDEAVSKQAITGIESIANYDLDIFYGDEKDFGGFGCRPQEKILEKIQEFSHDQQKNFQKGILAACREILSLSIEGSTWNYDKVTITRGLLPVAEGIQALRSTGLELLEDMYSRSESLEDKRHIFNILQIATATPNIGLPDSKFQQMVVDNTITILEFMKKIASEDDLQMMQKIEHDTYWHFYRGHNDPRIEKLALEIRDQLLADEEYKIFRVLIGFESIFRKWQDSSSKNDDINEENQVREKLAIELAQSISASNYEEWHKRILRYASIKSNDFATFPYFGKFLEAFGKHAPYLAIKLVQENTDKLNGFIVATLYGVALTDKNEAYKLIRLWTSEGKCLYHSLRFFEYHELDESILKLLFDKTCKQQDIDALNQIIITITKQFSADKKSFISSYFIPTIKLLTQQKNHRWIDNFYFRKESEQVIAAMSKEDISIVLDNLLFIPEIGHQTEEVLYQLAEVSPEDVVKFFIKRISKEKLGDSPEKFRAIPFEFYKLAKPLSTIPEKAVNLLRESYESDYSFFKYRGANFLKNIFPQFNDAFEKSLIKIAQRNTKDDLLFVIAILRNYEGQPFLHRVANSLIKTLDEDDKLLNEITIMLQNTGVVNGTHGFVKAYERKIEEMQPWLEDTDPKIKSFAENYIEYLRTRIENENKRADEEDMLRKYQYGSED